MRKFLKYILLFYVATFVVAAQQNTCPADTSIDLENPCWKATYNNGTFGDNCGLPFGPPSAEYCHDGNCKVITTDFCKCDAYPSPPPGSSGLVNYCTGICWVDYDYEPCPGCIQYDNYSVSCSATSSVINSATGQAPPKGLSLTTLIAILLIVLLVVAGYAVSRSGKPTEHWHDRHTRKRK